MRRRLDKAASERVWRGAGWLGAAMTALATVQLPAPVQAETAAVPAQPSSAQDLKAAIADIKRRLEQQRQAGMAPAASAAAEDLKSARDRIENLARTMVELRAERDSLRGQLLQARDQLGQTQQKLADLDAQRQGTEADAVKRVTGLTQDLTAAKAEAEALTKAKAVALAAAEEARKGVVDRDAKLAAAQQEIDRLRQNAASSAAAQQALSAEASQLRSRQGELAAELANVKAAAEAGQAETERRLTGEVADLKGKLAAAEHDNAELRAVASASVEEVRSLSEQLMAERTEKDKLVAASVELSSSKALQDLQLAAREDGESALVAIKGPPPAPTADTPPATVQLVARTEPAADDALNWDKTVLEGTLFSVGSDRLAPEAVEPLARIAREIKDSAGMVRIVGHTDSAGDPDQNQRLSLKRAQSVRDYLVATYGFDKARFKVDGMGADSPIASNDTTAGRRTNRRVEVFVAR